MVGIIVEFWQDFVCLSGPLTRQDAKSGDLADTEKSVSDFSFRLKVTYELGLVGFTYI